MTALTGRPAPLLALLLLLTCGVYGLGLSGPFVFDDLPNLVENSQLAGLAADDAETGLLKAAFSSDAGPLKRPISMLSFALNVQAFGMDPWAMKVVNVLIHLLVGLTLYALCRVLLRHWQQRGVLAPGAPVEGIALLATGLWLLHPMQLTSVLYIVQRMTSLSSLFTALGLLAYAHGRVRGDLRGLVTAVLGVAVFGLLAVLSKESGALILAYALALELCVFQFASPDRRVRLTLKIGYGVTVLLPALAGLAYLLVLNPALLERAYLPREFTLEERLLTQPRILWQYLGEIALPLPSRLGLYHDEIPLSTTLLQPWTTLPSLLGLLGLLLFALLRRRIYPVAALAVLWFLAGHLMESTLVPLELKFEHRNYLSILGPALWLACLLGQRPASQSPPRYAVPALLLIGALAGLTAQRAWIWDDGLRFELAEAAHHPDSARANYQAGLALINHARRSGGDVRAATREARRYFERAVAVREDFALAAAGRVMTYVDERSVPPELVEDLARRQRIARNPTANAMKDILHNQGRGRLALSTEQVQTLLQSTLENPYASPLVRAYAMNQLGEYHFNYLRDPQGAVSWTIAATEQAPDQALFRINLAKLALVLQRPDIARQAIDKAAELDRIELWAPEIARIRAEIAGASGG